MPNPDRPFRIPGDMGDGEVAAGPPPVVPPQPLPLPSSEEGYDLVHSKTVVWPAAQQNPDQAGPPWKNMR